jgi:hypothetical protein
MIPLSHDLLWHFYFNYDLRILPAIGLGTDSDSDLGFKKFFFTLFLERLDKCLSKTADVRFKRGAQSMHIVTSLKSFLITFNLILTANFFLHSIITVTPIY